MNTPRLARFALAFAALLVARAASAQPGEGGLPNLIGARAIVITDEWTGEGPGSPRVAAYRIERQGETWDFAGTARFTIARGHPGAREKTEAVSFPDSVILHFLQSLTAAPVAAGDYRPVMNRFDDYPVVTILLEFDDGTVEFHSSSQGEGRRPWRVTLKGPGLERVMVSDSDAPWRALRALDPYLKPETLNSLLGPQPDGSGGP